MAYPFTGQPTDTPTATSTPTATNTPAPTSTATPYAGGLASGVQSYWDFENWGGNYIYPVVGSEVLHMNNTTGGVTGKVGNAAGAGNNSNASNYDGNDLSSVQINTSSDFTWAGWVYIHHATTHTGWVISKGSSPTNLEYGIAYDGTSHIFKFCWGASGACISDGTTVLVDTWYFVAAGRSGSNAFIDVNNDGKTLTAASGWQNVSANFRFGLPTFGDASNGAWFEGTLGGQDGLVDEWGYWNTTALSDAQITSLWNGGAGCTYPFNSCAAGSPTATPTQIGTIYGNLIQNWDFNIQPLGPGSLWNVASRVIQGPARSDPIGGVANLPKGSCGPNYWVMSTPLSGPDLGGDIWQNFTWPGGPMYINFEAQTSDAFASGGASIVNSATGAEFDVPTIYNPWGTWVTFKSLSPAMAAGTYTLKFYLQHSFFSAPQGLAVDDVNVRAGYWGTDCTDPNYQGSIPPVGLAGTPTPFIAPTTIPPSSGADMLNNCDFESGLTSWGPNPAVVLQTTGGATGPNYVDLLSLPLGPPTYLNGDLTQDFYWPGGTMYMAFWLQDGGRVHLNVSNLQGSGSVYFAAPASSPTGWTREEFYFIFNQPGLSTVDLNVDSGAFAGVDGVTVATGDYAGGPCATQSTGSSNATQQAANQTATAAESPTAGAATATANAQGTTDANAFATYAAGRNATLTAVANSTGTATAAYATQTAAAQQTATAQGTPVPSATPSPAPRFTASPVVATSTPPSAATQTAAAATAIVGLFQTATAIAGLAETQQAQQTQTALARTAQAATQTAQAAANATNAAIVQQTAAAAQTSTAASATQAQATQNAGATQTALVATGDANQIATATSAAATQAQATANAQGTAHALSTQHAAQTQTALAATGDAQLIIQATQTAAALQTSIARGTSTASAAQTATAAARQTANAHATGTQQAAATQTALVATNNATTIAGATLTAVATNNQIATEQAQGTSTSAAMATNEALGTQQAQGTQTVEPRPEPAPYVDCVRPTNPLALADWMDYEVCRILTWFVWTPDNSQQVLNLQAGLNQYEPLGTLVEFQAASVEMQNQIGQYDWANTGLQQDDPIPLVTLFFPSTPPTNGILAGNINLTPGQPGSIVFVTVCTLKVGDVFGQAMAQGVCAAINWMQAIGLLAWVQFLFDVVVWVAFIRYSWNLITVTLPGIL